MIKLLLDANQSPKTGTFLVKTFGFNVKDLISERKTDLTDEQVVELAKTEKRVIITFDLDFGEIYHWKEKGKVGVIIIRLEDQTVESVTQRLEKFFKKEAGDINLSKELVVIEEDRIRVD